MSKRTSQLSGSVMLTPDGKQWQLQNGIKKIPYTPVASANSASRRSGAMTPFSGPKDIATFTKREDGRRNGRNRMKFMSSNNKDLSDSVNFPAGDELQGTMGF